jgi:hypothetical protein
MAKATYRVWSDYTDWLEIVASDAEEAIRRFNRVNRQEHKRWYVIEPSTRSVDVFLPYASGDCFLSGSFAVANVPRLKSTTMAEVNEDRRVHGLSDSQTRQLRNLQRYLELWYKENVAAVNEDARAVRLNFSMQHKGVVEPDGSESFTVTVTTEAPY